MGNTYVAEVKLAVGEEFEIFDPNVDADVKVRIIKSGWREQGGRCSCHPQWYDMFEAEVIGGQQPGRIVRGYTDKFSQYDHQAQEEYEDVCAFLLKS